MIWLAPFAVIFAIGSGSNIEEDEGINCILSLTSSHNRFFTVEAIITSKEISSNPELINTIKSYLNLNQNHIELPMPPFLKQDTLINGVKMRRLGNMIGVFRVWRYDNKGQILQSKLIINEHFQATCETIDKSNPDQFNIIKEKCTIKPTSHLRGLQNTLYIESYIGKRSEIVSKMVIKSLEERQKETGGFLILTGYEKEGFSTPKAVAVRKEINTDFQPRLINSTEKDNLILTNAKLGSLYDMLLDMERVTSN